MESNRTTTRPPEPPRLHLLPQTQLGRWALGLMLAAAASPLYWAVLTPLIKQWDPTASLRTVLVVVVAVPAIVAGGAAMARRDARSIGLLVAAAIVLLELAWTVFFVTSFGNAGAGLGIAVGAVAAALIGAQWARRSTNGPTAAR